MIILNEYSEVIQEAAKNSIFNDVKIYFIILKNFTHTLLVLPSCDMFDS